MYYVGIYLLSISAARANISPTPSPPSASRRATSRARWSRSPTASCRWRTPTPRKACCRARATWASSTSRTRAIPGSRPRAAACGAPARLRGDAVRRAQSLGALVQLNSTHPLTGLRIAHLGDIAKAEGAGLPRLRPQGRGAARASRQGRAVEPVLARARHPARSRSPFGLVVGAAGRLAAGACRRRHRRARHAAAALSVRHAASRPPSGADDQSRRLAGHRPPGALDGKAIGRANPGFIAGEDVIYQDKTGLLTVDFRSMLGFIGDLFAGWKRVPKHLDQQGQATAGSAAAWAAMSIMKELRPTAGRLRARPTSGRWCCA